MIRIFITGFFMGIADLIPGVSGGTIAFISGLYEELIQSITTFKWRFLAPLVFGMAAAIFTLSPILHTLLHDEVGRTLLFAAFFGLILGSVYSCGARITNWQWQTYLCLALGAIAAYALTQGDFRHIQEGSYLLFFGCGIIGVTAMLLPGLSGSYLLNIVGVYPLVIAALNDAIAIVKGAPFLWRPFFLLFSMGCGILIGVVLFSRILRWLLEHYHNATLAALTGFMIGAIQSVWPFWTYRLMDTKLIPDTAIWPTGEIAWMGFSIAAIALLITVLIESRSRVST